MRDVERAPAGSIDRLEAVSSDALVAGGFWRRAVGFVVDWLVVLPIALAALVIISSWYAGTATQLHGWRGAILSDSAALPAYLAGGLVLGAFLLLYFSCFWASGQSIGMVVTGTRVVHADTGEPLSFGRAVVRALLASIVGATFWGGLIAFVGELNGGLLVIAVTGVPYLWMLWDARGQTLIDRTVGSVVVLTGPAAARAHGRRAGEVTG